MGRRAGFTAESRSFWKHVLPGLDDSHVRETVSFPDLLIRVQQVRERTKGTQGLRSFFVLFVFLSFFVARRSYWHTTRECD
ncbi:MAG: hypothetical protein DMG11_00185 [Acidobacteria bacterium]|nr:MAG: hypothetical protein DMG11_00185 [Acidobacteriota bacterium]